jgi:hypothetical protein
VMSKGRMDRLARRCADEFRIRLVLRIAPSEAGKHSDGRIDSA